MKGVYAIGDVNGRIQLAHAASAQGIQVIDRILGQEDRETDGMIKSPVIREPVIPSVIFTSPEIGRSAYFLLLQTVRLKYKVRQRAL